MKAIPFYKEGQITYSDKTWRRKIERATLEKVKLQPESNKKYRAVVKGKEIIVTFNGNNHQEKLRRFCDNMQYDVRSFRGYCAF